MKVLIFLLSAIFSFSIFADQVNIEVNPKKPVVGEVFQLTFKISSDSNSEPDIKFSSGNFEVTGKSNQGISTRTVYSNGKLSVSREIMVSYDLVASKVGTDFIRDIKVDIDGNVLTHPSIAVSVLKEPEEIPDIFVRVEVPKKEIYVGEGIVVRYYLYSKGPITSIDIKKYPKLNKFLKRFLQEPDRTERVSIDGEIYLRSQIYAAKLFPEKVGEFKIDPISLSATYPTSRGGDPFGVFGLSRNLRTKNLSSETVKILAIPVPSPVPNGFTGLVGKHDIQLQFGKSKLIVNEPLEIKLIITGVGALENLDPPKIFESNAFEEFESNGDLKISDSEQATKTFDYTFLAKNNVSLPKTDKELFYFDPDLKKYESIKLEIPEIQVAGEVPKIASDVKDETLPENQKQSSEKLTKSDDSVNIPDLNFDIDREKFNTKYWLNWLNIFLVLGLFGFLVIYFLLKNIPRILISKDSIPKEFKKGLFNLSSFLKWISPLVQYYGKSPKMIIETMGLDSDAQNYFLTLLEENERYTFSKEKQDFRFTYNSNHFKKLQDYIEKIKDESNTKPD